jgi:PAS domain S-box-containing protein
MSFEHLAREELVALLIELTGDPAAKAHAEQATTNARVLHELQVHQVELEMQNRELRETRNALEESRNRYADLYDFAPVAYFTLDAHGVVRDVNLTGATMVGRDRAPMIGVPFLSLVDMEEPGLFWAHLRQCVQTRHPVVSELSFSIARHGPIAMQVVSVPVLDPSGQPVKFRTAFTDISQRKQAEAERNRAYESEQRLRARLEELDEASMAVSAALASHARSSIDTVLEVIKSHACIIADAEQAELVLEQATSSLPLHESVGELTQDGGAESVLRVPIHYAHKCLGSLTLRQKRGGGAFNAADVRGIQMLARRVAHAIEVARLNEVEAREHLRLLLLERTAHEFAGQLDVETVLHAMVRVSRLLVPDFADMCSVFLVQGNALRPVAAAHRDPEQEVLLAQLLNAANLERDDHGILGELLRTRRSTLLREHDPALQRADSDALGIRDLTRRLSAKSVMVVALVARDRVLGVLTFAMSESGRHYSQSQLLWAEEIASRCAFAIDNANLFDELRTAIRSRDNLLAVVSHDLRTPLSAIVLSAGALSPKAPVPERRSSQKHLDLIKQSAKWMDHLIDDLLTLSALDHQGFTVTLRAEHPSDLIARACQMAEPLLELKAQHLEQMVSLGVPDVSADRDRVLQVLSNLVGNALKFTPVGGTIRLSATPTDGGVRFSVSDTGAGIPPHQVARVFERCWTGDASGKGLGLGLYIAKRIVEAHGTQIWVESETGAGTTFYFTLPWAAHAEIRAPNPSAPH